MAEIRHCDCCDWRSYIACTRAQRARAREIRVIYRARSHASHRHRATTPKRRARHRTASQVQRNILQIVAQQLYWGCAVMAKLQMGYTMSSRDPTRSHTGRDRLQAFGVRTEESTAQSRSSRRIASLLAGVPGARLDAGQTCRRRHQDAAVHRWRDLWRRVERWRSRLLFYTYGGVVEC